MRNSVGGAPEVLSVIARVIAENILLTAWRLIRGLQPTRARVAPRDQNDA